MAFVGPGHYVVVVIHIGGSQSVCAEVQKHSQQVSNQSNVWLHVYDSLFACSHNDDKLLILHESRL
jgi:fatty acid-binding protein DegV